MRIFSILLLIAFSLLSAACYSQQSYLFLKKGRKKVRVWNEGDIIRLELKSGGIPEGRILLLRNDSIFLTGDLVFRTTDVKRVLVRRKTKKPFPINAEQAAWIAGGVALTTVGLRVAKWETNTGRALLYSSVIGFGPILITALTNQISFRRKDYPIGKKFRLQVLDFYVPQPLPGNKAF